jgi:hypothetical protein
MIYDYLFYKSYQLALRSRNFDDAPVFGGIWGVIPCLMFNAFTLMFLIDSFLKSELSSITGVLKYYKYIFSGVLICSMLFYYWYKERWKRIIIKYEEKENMKGRNIHPIIILGIAYIISFGMLLLAGMYKNGDGIFS